MLIDIFTIILLMLNPVNLYIAQPAIVTTCNTCKALFFILTQKLKICIMRF